MAAVAISSSSSASDTLPETGVRIELGLFGILQQDRGVELRQVDLAHRPAAEAALGDFLVVQQHHVLVACILLDVAVEVADRVAPAFDRLQEDAGAIAKDAGDAAGGLCVRDLARIASMASGLVSTARLA
jgi:hypothetical protein